MNAPVANTPPETSCTYALTHLQRAIDANADGAMMAVLACMEQFGAGYPQVALLQEEARSDARFWAETASPIELECYMLAASDRLKDLSGMFHSRQIKRLVAALWHRMSPDEKDAFRNWVVKNEGGE